jgi:acetyl-CoA carboxylase biotin carboxyl carrier protein
MEGNKGMDYDKILELVDKIEASEFTKFEYSEGDFSLKLEKEKEQVIVGGNTTMSDALLNNGCGLQENALNDNANAVNSLSGQATMSNVGNANINTQINASVGENVANVEAYGSVIESPLVGTFYSSAVEGGEPLVSVGDKVKKGQVVAIVEAMKLMNEIESEVDGVVTDVLVQNGNPVEYGQILFRVK